MTIRYRAIQRVSYALALQRLVGLARTHAGPVFYFGPMDLTFLERNGLIITGEDLGAVRDALAGVPGLSEVPA